MKFYGTPNMGVYERPKAYSFKKKKGVVKKQIIFRFDSNGEFETSDQTLIERLVKKFKHEKTEVKHEEEKKSFKCKKCNFETDNKGLLMAHYREHKKEE